MTTQNNFKLLAEEIEELHPPPSEIEEHIFSNLHILSLMGKSMEMFIPGAIDLFVQMLGGNPQTLGTIDLSELGMGNADEDNNEPGISISND